MDIRIPNPVAANFFRFIYSNSTFLSMVKESGGLSLRNKTLSFSFFERLSYMRFSPISVSRITYFELSRFEFDYSVIIVVC
mgnify:CR=1 FL=1